MSRAPQPRVAALFPPWTNTATQVVLLAGALLGAGLLAAPMWYARSPYATGQDDPVLQPIAFDHRHHVGDDGVPCLYCHDGADRAPYAGIPPTARCMGCHAQVWNDSTALAPVRASAASGEPIHWRRVTAVPDFVYFDHAIHVRGGIDCARCHGDVAGMRAVYQVAPMTMQWCLDCHRNPPAGLRSLTHCSTCHR